MMAVTNPEPVAEDGNLPATLRALEDALSALIQPRSEVVDGQLLWTDSLYVQLQESLPGNQGNGHGGQARSVPPTWVDAMETLMNIDSMIEVWEPRPLIDASDDEPPPITVIRLRAIQSRAWRPQDCRSIQQITDIVLEWVEDIKVLFINEPVRALWAAEGGGFAPCPTCEKTMAKKRDRGGEMVQYPALQVLPDGATRCMACKTSWGPELAMWVCRQLGYPLPKGVLE